jgi:hypothetical protein
MYTGPWFIRNASPKGGIKLESESHKEKEVAFLDKM